MTDEEALKKYNDMLKYFGTLPNFEHEPKQFAHCVKMFNYYNERKQNDNTNPAN